MHDAWKRIAIVGCSGAGKSTLARRIETQVGSPHLLLDNLGLVADWKLRPLEDFRAEVDRATSQPTWIADGNWRPVRDLVWPRATAIVWLDTSLTTCFRRVFVRTIHRSLSGERVCNGNRETLWKAFARRDSILRWVLAKHGEYRRNLPPELAAFEAEGKVVCRLRSQREIERLISEIGG